MSSIDLSSPIGVSDESSCEESTGPTTPDSSPLFCASRLEDVIVTPLGDLLDPRTAVDLFSVEKADKATFPVKPVRDAPIQRRIRNICVIGAGYVGGPTAAVMALHNPSIRIEVVDKDPRRIRRWNSAHLPLHESGLVDVVRVSRDGACHSQRTTQSATEMATDSESEKEEDSERVPNLFFTCDTQAGIARADLIMLAVNTPTKTFGVGAGRATNMGTFDAAIREVAQYARPGAIIVEKSTVPCGTAQRVRKVLDAIRPGVPFEVLSNPEFLSEGSAVKNLLQPDRVLIGSAPNPAGRAAAAALTNVYAAWVPRQRILEVNQWSSELAKLVSNAMLAQRISSINSISAICDRTGADVDEIARAAGLDPRIGPQFLKSGLGFGGSCFRKDIASLTYLAESLGLPEVAHYWAQVNSINDWQRDRFTYKVISRLDQNLVGKKIAILGFAFKGDTGDTRESLAVDVIRTLLEERPAEIAIFDPCCLAEDIYRELQPILTDLQADRVQVYADAYQACEKAHAIVVVNESDQFRTSQPKKKAAGGRDIPPVDPTPDIEMHGFSPVRGETVVISGASLSFQCPPAPSCAEDCPECQSTGSSVIASREPLEWARIAYHMKDPKWVFDGRGILDVAVLGKLGFRVDTLGRRTTEPTVPFSY